jgi:sortase A
MRQLRTGSRRIASWAERSLWALGLALLAYWGFSQAQIRFEQARLEESLFAGGSHSRAAGDDALAADLATSSIGQPAAPILEPGSPLALIEIPRVDLRAMVVEGVDSHSLKTAAGHLPGTAIPGYPGNSVVAAHRDTLFAGLKNVRLGDVINWRTGGRAYTYRVSSIDVVTPTAMHVIEPTSHPSLTLITCFPFDFVGPAPMRFIVSATQESAMASGEMPASGAELAVKTASRAERHRPLDPRVVSFLSGSLVKPGAN